MGLSERQEFIRVRVTKEEKEAVERLAKQAGQTISEWLRSVVKNTTNEIGPANALARRNLELLIQIGLISSKLLDKAFGSEEGKEIRELAKQKAGEMAHQVLEQEGLKEGR